MNMEQMLRQENYQLKNEITDLKNAFDLNRDILKILSSNKNGSEPQSYVLLQIITRLTTVNNQSMLTALTLIQEKNVLRQENLRLNIELQTMEDRLSSQIDRNQRLSQPTESKMLMQEQFNSLKHQVLAANQQRIAKDQEIEYWRQKYNSLQKETLPTLEENPSTYLTSERSHKIKRKHESNQKFRTQVLLAERDKQLRNLKRYAEQLEQRLIILIKSRNLREQHHLTRRQKSQERFMEREKQQLRLFKFALNDISVEIIQDEQVLTLTERYREKDKMKNSYVKIKRSLSCPSLRMGCEYLDQMENDPQ